MFQGLEPWLRPYATWLYQVAQQYGLQPRVTSVRRTWGRQKVLYDRYMRGESTLPAAPPGRSLHQYGRAFDMVTNSPSALGSVWRRMGGKWYESDPPHFEV